MQVPIQFKDYKCSDYFESEHLARGIWSELDQLWFVLAADDVFERSGLAFLVICRPGVDGIEFGYRKGLDGLWAYYPVSRAFSEVAPTTADLVHGWLSGTIKV